MTELVNAILYHGFEMDAPPFSMADIHLFLSGCPGESVYSGKDGYADAPPTRSRTWQDKHTAEN